MADLENALLLRLEATLSKFEKQMARARAVAKSSTTGIEADFTRMNGRIATTSAQGAAGLMKYVNISGRGRFVLQNTANQLGDIAVSMQGGIAPAKVMAQQLPQLLGGFGALGGALGLLGPLLGTLAAIGIPVAAMLLRNGDAAGTAEEQIKAFAEAVSAADKALSEASSAIELATVGGLDQLQEKYGEVTDSILKMHKAIADMQVTAAKSAVDQVIGDATGAPLQSALAGLANTIDADANDIRAKVELLRMDIDQILANPATAQGAAQQSLLADLKAQLTEAEQLLAVLEGRFAEAGAALQYLEVPPDVVQSLVNYQAALEAAMSAGDYEAVADALAGIRETIAAAGAEIDQSVVNGLLDAEARARELSNTMSEAEAITASIADAANAAAGAIDGAAGAAGALAGNLGAALANMQALARAEASALANREARIAAQANLSDETGVAAGATGAIAPNYLSQGAIASALGAGAAGGGGGGGGGRRGGGGGGGGGGGAAAEIDKMSQAFERLRGQLDPAYASLQKLGEAQDTLNWALENGKITLPEYQALLAQANEEFKTGAGDVADYVQELGNFMGGFLVDIYHGLRNGESAWDAFKNAALNALDSIAEAALRMAGNAIIQMLFGGLGGGGPTLGGGFGGGLFGGGLFGAGGGLPSFDGGGYTGSGARAGGVDGKGGFPAILHPNETVLTGQRGEGARVLINISGNLPEGTVRQREGRIDIDLTRAVAAAIEGGGADKAMRNRYGVAPRGI